MWIENNTLFISVPFTWNLPWVRTYVLQQSTLWTEVVVGGPAISLMPDFLSDLPWVTVSVNDNSSYNHNILLKINPMATRTTVGCPNRCGFCGVKVIEPTFVELEDWPDFPIVCDNNFLAAKDSHRDKVYDRLEKWGWCDFNQGLDTELLSEYDAERLKRIGRPIIRLALDHINQYASWNRAFDCLRKAKIPKKLIRTYCLIGYYNENPDNAWKKCQLIEESGTIALPMWFHPLNALMHNAITPEQRKAGWTDYERKRIMQWFYWHKQAVKE